MIFMASRTPSRPLADGDSPSPNGHARRGRTQSLPGVPVIGTEAPSADRSATGGISPPPKLRSRPALIAVGVALVALGGAAAAYLTTAVGHTEGVLAVRTSLDRGEVIRAQDLVRADINADPALRTVPAADREQVVGKRTAVDLAAGTLLTPEALTTTVVPAEGQSLVGLSLQAGQLPAQPLRQGATVRLVDTPRAQDEPPTGTPTATTATVVEAHAPAEDGSRIIDVTVPTAQAVGLAARAATGRIALVLDPGTG